ncbi:RhoGAP-domain-containing protein [Wallemia mellicola]|uniref:RhoGAP-domain-containing protein n=1 Tax=Wallemia mellicola TaxID=1708541 RepID=A0A4T0M660_9BASI|nr:hypothetical protein E3Q23_01189 [Wallemia mellicola]TIB81009.1 RhoGAP-domain-containing protein [Wallemia mellicola]TIC13233.1 RhoGAP-domain-containing protein [Wallemia mellicola]TIC14866.1 RhoGAP-domain-containing protein [Wallemia mellicola]TIC28117.1 RhoGAP-domain-containing protein [Wallemia mellicola]
MSSTAKILTLKDILDLKQEDPLLFLLQERNNLANQNNQLWSLIDKQKTTINRLNDELDGLPYQHSTPPQPSPPEIIAPKPLHLNNKQLLTQSPPPAQTPYMQSNHSFDDALTKFPIRPAMLSAIEKAQHSQQPPQRGPYMQQFNHSFNNLPQARTHFQQSQVVHQSPPIAHQSPPITHQSPPIAHQSASVIQKHPPQARTTEDKPAYFKLTPSLVPTLKLAVLSSSIKPNRDNKDSYAFTISVKYEQSNAEWKVEKSYDAIYALDMKIREIIKKPYFKHTKGRLMTLPDKNTFKDRSPNKIIHQKILLENYFNSIISIPHTYSIIPKNSATPHMELAAFLSSNFAKSSNGQINGHKDGYLTKKGKNFGGWKARYFVIGKEGILDYYEQRGGNHIGSVRIHDASIGRQHPQRFQSDPNGPESENAFRHAFLIIERHETTQKEKDRHILCAENDQERDAWINTLLWHQRAHSNAATSSPVFPHEVNTSPVNAGLIEEATPNLAAGGLKRRATSSSKPRSREGGSRDGDRPRTSDKPRSKDDIQPGNPVTLSSLPPDAASKFSIPKELQEARQGGSFELSHSNESQLSLPPREDSKGATTPLAANNKDIKISKPMNGATIPEGVKFGDDQQNEIVDDKEKSEKQQERERKAKSRGFWGAFSGSSKDKTQKAPVFGVSINDSLQQAQIAGLPAVVFRCIKYLQHVKADEEEGIYRLSGSSAQVKALKERFNNEGDINLVETDDFFDPHAITGLLKLYFRELPNSVLTRELHFKFLQVTELPDAKKRIRELGRLVSALPIANYALLRALISHLTDIVSNEELNRMSLRNVGIVFSPTLGIPAPLFGLFLTEFKYVFNVADDGKPAPIEESTDEEQEPRLSTTTTASDKPSSQETTPTEIIEDETVDVLMPAPKLHGEKKTPPPAISTKNLQANGQSAPLSPLQPIPPRPSRQRRDNRNSSLYEDVNVDSMLGLRPKNIREALASAASENQQLSFVEALNDNFEDSDVDPAMNGPA